MRTASFDRVSADESTPLISRVPRIGTPTRDHSSSSRGHSTGSNAEGTSRQAYAHELLQLMFQNRGLTMVVQDVTIVTYPVTVLWFINRWITPAIQCQTVSAVMEASKLHVVVDVDGKAGRALLDAMVSNQPCHAGMILLEGRRLPLEKQDFRRMVGYVTGVDAAVPHMTVEQNLWFVLNMRTREESQCKKQLVEATALFTALDLQTRVRDLDACERFRLRLAMELVLDPPIVFAAYPFENMDYASELTCSSLLRDVSVVLRKTVIVSSRSLPHHFFRSTSSAMVFGKGGVVLYSGSSQDMIPYFNDLNIPRSRTSQLSSARHMRGAITDFFSPIFPPDTVTPSCTPPRISSHYPEDYGSVRASAQREVGRPSLPAVVVLSCSDVIDLAVEWADSTTQTLFYAASYYDSTDHAELMAAIAAITTQPVPSPSELAERLRGNTRSQHCALQPFILLVHYTRQFLTGSELISGVACLSVGLITVSALVHYLPEDQGGMYNIRGMIFLLFVLTLVVNQVTEVDAYEQLLLFVHQRNTGLLNTASYVLCLAVRVIFVRAVYVALFLPVIIVALQASPKMAILAGAISATHALLLFTGSAVIPSRRISSLTLQLYFGYCLICSGFLLNLRSMPALFGYMSLMRWGYGPALHEQLRKKPFSCDGTSNTSYCYTGDDYLEISGLDRESFWFSILLLSSVSALLLGVLTASLAVK